MLDGELTTFLQKSRMALMVLSFKKMGLGTYWLHFRGAEHSALSALSGSHANRVG
jgi:hypothetical protein